MEVNKNGLSEDKIDVINFTCLITHHKSIYFYFTQNNTFLYPISTVKGKKETKITRRIKAKNREKRSDNKERKKEEKEN